MNINIKEVPRAATHCRADGADGYECPCVYCDDGDWFCRIAVEDILWCGDALLETDDHGNPLRSDSCIASEMAAFEESDAHRKADAAEAERDAYCIDECDGTDQNGMCQTCRALDSQAKASKDKKVNPCDDRHPCAKCGSETLAYKTQLIRCSKDTGHRMHWIECFNCGHKGSYGTNEGRAVHFWNAENPKACGCPGGPIEHRMDCRRRDPA